MLPFIKFHSLLLLSLSFLFLASCYPPQPGIDATGEDMQAFLKGVWVPTEEGPGIPAQVITFEADQFSWAVQDQLTLAWDTDTFPVIEYQQPWLIMDHEYQGPVEIHYIVIDRYQILFNLVPLKRKKKILGTVDGVDEDCDGLALIPKNRLVPSLCLHGHPPTPASFFA